MNQGDYIKQLESTIESLTEQIANLTETVNYLTKKLFGHSSEKTKKDDVEGQLGLFNEAELEAHCAAVEPTLEVVAGYKRDTKKKTLEALIKDLEVIEVPCTLHENNKDCPWCNTELVPIGKEQVRQDIQFISAKVKIISYIRYAYECPACKKDDSAVIIIVKSRTLE